MRDWPLILVLCFVCGVIGALLQKKMETEPCPTVVLRPYHVTFPDPATRKINDIRIRASRIDRRDGCVIFYREEVVDTIICVPQMDQLFVTEEN